MPTLIVHLSPPGSTPGQELRYVLSADGLNVASHGSAPAALLPSAAGTEVVAVVPARALSWHQVTLPRGTLGQRATAALRSVLDGLLEDRVLDELSALHFAVAPDARPGAPVWVAACDKAWLRDALAVLEAAERRATRIVPEFAPETAEAPSATLHVIGEAEQAELVWRGPGGVSVVPMGPAAQALCASQLGEAAWNSLELVAEPAVAALAERQLGRKVTLLQSSQRWLQAALGPWDLAQFDLSSSGGQRLAKRVAGGLGELWAGPRWRAARWAAGALVAVQLIGLNAWAWQQNARLTERRQQVTGLLTTTFPQVKVVVDAPLQMERELALLRQGSGGLSAQDLEAILGALGNAAPAALAVTSIDYGTGEARLRVSGGAAAAVTTTGQKLQTMGYAVRADGDQLVIRPELRP